MIINVPTSELQQRPGRVRERFKAAQQDIYEATATISPEDVERLVQEAIRESRHERTADEEE